jgi:hypothetical protein
MVMVAKEPPYLICIGKSVASRQLPAPSKNPLDASNWQSANSLRLPFPAPRREAQEELNT